ncbi:MAG: DUF1501 domain-containing protein [Verrucomicrobia bacterium]|nr:DUF1501 domain-containing protein [Verrucomicrobiota bacterium]
MPRPALPDLSRRRFIGQACCAAVGATGFLSSLASLRLMAAAASPGGSSVGGQATAPDYKALVCLFLQGGNDANNLVIPTDSASYAAYATARSNLALPQAGVLPITPRTSDGRTWGLHPALAEIRQLFGTGQAAILANVGTLAFPTTLAQYKAGSITLPTQLYSHSDQQVQWQSSLPDQRATTGWGGRLADLVNAVNTSSQLSMSISLAGTNFFQVGRTVSQYAISSSGAVTFSGTTGGNNPLRYAAQKDLFAQSNPALLDTAFGGLSSASIANSDLVNAALAGAPTLATVFPATSLGNQLKMVARLISTSAAFGLKRQVFFCQVGGYDLHASQVTASDTTTGAHATLFAQLSQAVAAFYNATVELGVANQVTTFTASDFGRTLSSNGDGSDHGWGSHHLVVGGAVRGTDLYGQMPDLALNSANDTGRGRWIPSTSVDEYAATLATWFGVSATNLPTVLPNIGRFAHPNLGFLG